MIGKITKERPHGYKTEAEAWDEDTEILKEIEKSIDNKKIGRDDFNAKSKIFSVSDRCSLDGGVGNRYRRRMKCCDELLKRMEKLDEKKIGDYKGVKI